MYMYICESEDDNPEHSSLRWVFASELDALGDELLLDDDSSYLDEASSAPSIPEGMPSDSKTNKVTLISHKLGFISFTPLVSNMFDCIVQIQVICLTGLCVSQDGVLVDEFGLPQIPAT